MGMAENTIPFLQVKHLPQLRLNGYKERREEFVKLKAEFLKLQQKTKAIGVVDLSQNIMGRMRSGASNSFQPWDRPDSRSCDDIQAWIDTKANSVPSVERFVWIHDDSVRCVFFKYQPLAGFWSLSSDERISFMNKETSRLNPRTRRLLDDYHRERVQCARQNNEWFERIDALRESDMMLPAVLCAIAAIEENLMRFQLRGLDFRIAFDESNLELLQRFSRHRYGDCLANLYGFPNIVVFGCSALDSAELCASIAERIDRYNAILNMNEISVKFVTEYRKLTDT